MSLFMGSEGRFGYSKFYNKNRRYNNPVDPRYKNKMARTNKHLRIHVSQVGVLIPVEMLTGNRYIKRE
jgi:hypothetical protein